MENNNEVYRRLIEKATKYNVLLRALLQNSRLGYNQEFLRYDDEKISAVLKALEYEYSEKLNELKKEADINE